MHKNIISYLKTIGREPDNELFDTINIEEGEKWISYLQDNLVVSFKKDPIKEN